MAYLRVIPSEVIVMMWLRYTVDLGMDIQAMGIFLQHKQPWFFILRLGSVDPVGAVGAVRPEQPGLWELLGVVFFLLGWGGKNIFHWGWRRHIGVLRVRCSGDGKLKPMFGPASRHT